MAIALLTYSLQATTMDELGRLTGEAFEKGKIDLYMQEVHGFDESNYPYYENVNECGGEGLTQGVYDTYIYKVTVKVLGKKKKITLLNADFRDACNKHDECYMTYEKSKEYCENKFAEHLGTACYEGELKDFGSVIKNLITGFAPVGVCLGVAANYAVVANVAGYSFYPNAQKKAQRYKEALDDMFSTEPDKQNAWYECKKEEKERRGSDEYFNIQDCFQEKLTPPNLRDPQENH